MMCPANDNPASCEIHAVIHFHVKTRVPLKSIMNYARRATQNKRRRLLISGVLLLHDNTRPHTEARTRALLEHFNWELFDHPPYSPDLAQSDYHLFTYLKNWLGSQHFNNKEELI
jgi:histone-lysine N-methyltransferase SETMAR